MELLLVEAPDAVTVRAIADRAGSHHPFVATLFGGKVGLLADIYPRVVAEAVSEMDLPIAGRGLRPQMVRLARLATWLATNGAAIEMFRSQALVKVVSGSFSTRFGLDDHRGRLLAELVVASTLSWILYPDVVSDGRPELLSEQAAFIDSLARALVANS